MFLELEGQTFDDPLDVGLDEVVVEADAFAEVGVELGGAVGHLHHQARGPVFLHRTQHQRQRVVTGDQVRVNAHSQHPQAARQVVLPQRLVPLRVPVAAEDVVDQDVEPAVLVADPIDQRRDRVRTLVVHHESRAAAAGIGDRVPGLLDGLRTVHLRRTRGATAASGRVHVGAGSRQLDRDRPTSPAGRSRNQRDSTRQWSVLIHGLTPSGERERPAALRSSWAHKPGDSIPPRSRSPSRTRRSASHEHAVAFGALIHEPALSAASEVDKSFLLAMAHDDGPSKMADIQRRLDADVNYASQYRLRLIAAELIHSTRHGYVDFALPYLREYLREHAAADV